MEDVIVYLVIAASIVASIYNNYQKQKKANQNRDIRKPAPAASAAPQASRPASRPKPASAKAATAVKPKSERARSEIKSTIEGYQFGNYETLESAARDLGDLDIHDFSTPEGFEEEESIEEMERNEKANAQRNIHTLFGNADDLKKAVLYKEILERKF